MRLVHYYAINKNTNKNEYTNCDKIKVQEYINNKANKSDYAIAYKWLNI